MKITLTAVLIAILVAACSGTKTGTGGEALDITAEEQAIFETQGLDTVRISNDSTEYEILIIDNGFYPWLSSIAHPRGYYSQGFMEGRNRVYVTNWNNRVLQPQAYDPDLYMFTIDYEPNIDYGYEVNYMLFNYFIYFQRKYNQRLGPFNPRIN